MNNKVLIILGMHRSGTSLVAQWLHRCGLHIGTRLVGAGRGNIEGHFEDRDFLDLHRSILISNNLPDTGLVSEFDTALNNTHLAEIKGLIALKNSLFEEWGWKEPRTCLFLEQYMHVLPAAKYIILLRDYNSVVDSLIRRDFDKTESKFLQKCNFVNRLIWKCYKRRKVNWLFHTRRTAHYLKVWILYNEKLLQHLQEIDPRDYLLIDVNSLTKQSDMVLGYIKESWSFTLSSIPFLQVYNKSLINNKADIQRFIKDDSLIEKAMQLTAALQKFHFTHLNKTNIITEVSA
jgi:hypothetical protein